MAILVIYRVLSRQAASAKSACVLGTLIGKKNVVSPRFESNEITMKKRYSIAVDYSKSLAEMIEAGNYDWIHLDIMNKHFPVKGSGKLNLKAEVIRYNRPISLDDVLRDLDRRGLRPANLPELLVFGEKYHDERHKYPIVELGQHWAYGRYRYVVYFFGGGSGRILDLRRWMGIWSGGFLAIPK